eukprot:Rmarinus@m.28542
MAAMPSDTSPKTANKTKKDIGGSPGGSHRKNSAKNLGPTTTGGYGPSLPGRTKEEEQRKIVLWCGWSVAEGYRTLRKSIPAGNVKPISSIARVGGKTGDRLDILVETPGQRVEVLEAIRKYIPAAKRRARLGRTYNDRRAARKSKPQPKPSPRRKVSAKRRVAVGPLRLGTWNIQSVTTAEAELAQLLREEKLDILGLQETRANDENALPRIRGYISISNNEGMGVGLFVRRELARGTTLLPPYHSDTLWAKIVHPSFPEDLYVCVVHVRPSWTTTERGMVLREITRRVRQVNKKGSIVILGDLNAVISPGSNMEAWNDQWCVIPTQRAAGLGNIPTRPIPNTGGVGGRTIDYILTSTDLSSFVRSHWVKRDLGGSDHFPVVAEVSGWRWQLVGKRGPKVKLNAPGLTQRRDKASRKLEAAFNKWSPLEEAEDQQGEPTIVAWEREALAALSDFRSRSPTDRPGVPRWWTPKTARLQKERRKSFRALGRAIRHRRSELVISRRKAKYLEAKQASLEANKAAKRDGLRRHMEQGLALFRSDPRRYWVWVRSFGTGIGAPQLGPVVAPNGEMVSHGPMYLNTWAKHFESVNNPPVPAAAEWVRRHWREVEERTGAEDFGPESLGLTTEENLNGPLQMKELIRAIRQCRNGKAPGEDGVPYELYKCCLPEGEEDPDPQALKTLLTAMERVWESGVVPETWKRAVICPIFKRGDKTDVQNYRGISLLPVASKLLLAIIRSRLQGHLDRGGRLRPEQAGFRGRRSCLEQNLVLREVLMRRKARGRGTVVVFVDLRQAYDRVWRSGLWEKMAQKGIGGRMLGFIREIYRGSRAVVRIEDEMSAEFPLEQGVRQGCVISPTLFSVYIDDLLKEVEDYCGLLGEERGVAVPGVETFGEGRLSGLLFADDLALLAENADQMQVALDGLTRWLQRWRMTAGIAKCGVLRVLKSGETDPTGGYRTLVLEGMDIPEVEEYRYLGVWVHRSLSWEREMEVRRATTERAMRAQLGLLRTRHVSLGLKVNVVKAMILPVAQWGTHLWGLTQAITKRLDGELARAMLVALGSPAGTDHGATRVETGLWPVYWAVRHQLVGYLVSWAQNDGIWISALLKTSGTGTGQAFWVSGSVIKQIKANVLRGSRININDWLRDAKEDPIEALGEARRTVTELYHDSLARTAEAETKSTLRNVLRGKRRIALSGTPTWLYDEPTRGVRVRSQLRLNSFRTTRRMVGYTNWVVRSCLWKCPFCSRMEAETPEHFVVRCSAFKEIREEWFMAIRKEWGIFWWSGWTTKSLQQRYLSLLGMDGMRTEAGPKGQSLMGLKYLGDMAKLRRTLLAARRKEWEDMASTLPLDNRAGAEGPQVQGGASDAESQSTDGDVGFQDVD